MARRSTSQPPGRQVNVHVPGDYVITYAATNGFETTSIVRTVRVFISPMLFALMGPAHFALAHRRTGRRQALEQELVNTSAGA